MVKVDHITFAPSGGAGLVAKGLVETQALLGHDVRLITVNPSGLREQPFQQPSLVLRAVIDDQIVRKPNSLSMISLARRGASTLDTSIIRKDSILHLHWIEGVANHNQVKRWLDNGRGVVWSLHDMAPLTGGCHSNLKCMQFEDGCRSCPQVRTIFQRNIAQSFKEISSIDFSHPKLKLVAPSKSHAETVRNSLVFNGCDITHIPNPISNDFFEPQDRALSRQKLGISPDEFVGIAIASQLDNPLKGIMELIEMFLAVTREMGVRSRFIIVGEGGRSFEEKYKNCLWVGQLRAGELAGVLAAADILASGSASESAGMTIREAGALSIPSISLRNGGSDDLILDGDTGLLVDNIQQLSESLRELILHPAKIKFMGLNARRECEKDSTPLSVAYKYLDLYKKV